MEYLVRNVTIEKAAEVTGLTEKAIRRKIEKGIWLHGVWVKADGRIMINLQEYDRWVDGHRSVNSKG